jgi:hypothetical protein
MKLTSILFRLAVPASFVVAFPLEVRSTRLTAVGVSHHNANRKASVTPPINGRKSMAGVSKRADLNVLGKRDGAVLWGYVDSNCNGIYYEYSLDDIPPWSCWETISFNSAYVPSADGSGLPYNVYVGASCDTGSHFHPHIPQSGV